MRSCAHAPPSLRGGGRAVLIWVVRTWTEVVRHPEWWGCAGNIDWLFPCGLHFSFLLALRERGRVTAWTSYHNLGRRCLLRSIQKASVACRCCCFTRRVMVQEFRATVSSSSIEGFNLIGISSVELRPRHCLLVERVD